MLRNLCVALKDIEEEDHNVVCRELARATWSHYYSLEDSQWTTPQCRHPADMPTTGEFPVATVEGALIEGV